MRSPTAGGLPWGDDAFPAELDRAEERVLRPERVRTRDGRRRGP